MCLNSKGKEPNIKWECIKGRKQSCHFCLLFSYDITDGQVVTERVDLCFAFYRIRKVIAFRQFAKIFKKLTFKVLIFQTFRVMQNNGDIHVEKKDLISHRFLDSAKQNSVSRACFFFLSTFPLFFYSKALQGPKAWVLQSI